MENEMEGNAQTIEREAACRGRIKEKLRRKRRRDDRERKSGSEETACHRAPAVIKNRSPVVLAIRMTNDVVDGAKLAR